MSDLDDRLRQRFGLPGFHSWQREAVDALLTGKGRVLVVAPTGGGKSLCYQFPATELGGTTIVISPLIALMDDQVRALEQRGIPATYLASTLDPELRRVRERAIRQGAYRLVYVAPERLAAPSFVDFLAKLEPPLVAIDEAHCISQWGHDFRPDYLRLGAVLRQLDAPRVLACTATATPDVRSEILERLGLSADETAVVLRGFARPNLHLEVRDVDRMRDRMRLSIDALTETIGRSPAKNGAAIVYAGTRRNVERITDELRGEGFRATAYHAGLDPETRAAAGRAFSDREVDIVVATNAFGMGIDRPDIRLVVHVQAPGSIEAYYQEVGRAGRDGKPARGLLLTGAADLGLRRRLIESGTVSTPDAEPSPRALEHAKRQWDLFLDLLRYVEAGSCRHDFILRYFGDEREVLGGCGHCDVCERLEELGASELAPTGEDDLVVRKVLSGVARARGRVGLRAIADMLAGKGSARLDRLGLTSLSTFGLLSGEKPEWLVLLLRRLVTAGLVDITADPYPVVLLTRAGLAAMKGEAPCRVLLPDRARTHPTKKRARRDDDSTTNAQPFAEDPALYEALRAARRTLAEGKGVPAYVVCHDRTLHELAARRPGSLAELAEVHGMGPARIEAYGAAFLDVLERFGTEGARADTKRGYAPVNA